MMILKNEAITEIKNNNSYKEAKFENDVKKENFIIIKNDNADKHEGIFTYPLATCVAIYFFYSSTSDAKITHLGMFHSPGDYSSKNFHKLIKKLKKLDNNFIISNDTIKVGVGINSSHHSETSLRYINEDFYEDISEYKLKKENATICPTRASFAINFDGKYGEYKIGGYY